MASSRSFKDLVVWQKSLALCKEVYAVTAELPKSDAFGLVSQMRRSAVSIPSNIAEGAKRGTQKDFLQFLRVASGSAAELETQVLLASDLYPAVSWAKASQLLSEVQRMLTSFVNKFKL